MSEVAVWAGATYGVYHHGVLLPDEKHVIHLIPGEPGTPGMKRVFQNGSIGSAVGGSAGGSIGGSFGVPIHGAVAGAVTGFTLSATNYGTVEKIPLQDFLRFPGDDLYDVIYDNPRPTSEIVQRAESFIGPVTYNLFFNNSETFAKYCTTGIPLSGQVVDGVAVGATVGKEAAAGGTGLVGIFTGLWKAKSHFEQKDKHTGILPGRLVRRQ